MLKTADACCILVKNPVYWRHLVLKKILSPISLMFCFFQVSMTLFLMAYDCFVRAFSYIHIYITLFGGSCLSVSGRIFMNWMADILTMLGEHLYLRRNCAGSLWTTHAGSVCEPSLEIRRTKEPKRFSEAALLYPVAFFQGAKKKTESIQEKWRSTEKKRNM